MNAKQVRGRLRFWWRACHAHRYSSARELLEADTQLFGQNTRLTGGDEASGPGLVDVVVEVLQPGKLVNAEQLIPRATPQTGSQEGVFLFAFNEQKENKLPPADGLGGVTFRVKLCAAQAMDEVQKVGLQDSLVAWILFGGIGARTRRGLGTLKCEEAPGFLSADSEGFRQWGGSLDGTATGEWTSLSGGAFVVVTGPVVASLEGERSEPALRVLRQEDIAVIGAP